MKLITKLAATFFVIVAPFGFATSADTNNTQPDQDSPSANPQSGKRGMKNSGDEQPAPAAPDENRKRNTNSDDQGQHQLPE